MNDGILYCDTSAILSMLVDDQHSDAARRAIEAADYNIVSTLAIAETLAVMGRRAREAPCESALLKAAAQTFFDGTWLWTLETPPKTIIANLAQSHPLRGADLWHLACAKALAAEFPELQLLTFDKALLRAADDEGFAFSPSDEKGADS